MFNINQYFIHIYISIIFIIDHCQLYGIVVYSNIICLNLEISPKIVLICLSSLLCILLGILNASSISDKAFSDPCTYIKQFEYLIAKFSKIYALTVIQTKFPANFVLIKSFVKVI